jgi:hypothetical protein
VEEYLHLVKNLETNLREILVRSIREKWTFRKNQVALARIGRLITNASKQLDIMESSLGVSGLTADRTKALSEVYTNVYMLFNEIHPRRFDFEDLKQLKVLAEKIDSALTVRYTNNSRNNFYNYLKGYVEDYLGRQEAEEYFGEMISAGTVFVQVTNTPTKCFICIPWLGRVGTIGKTVEGYPRLDGLFPIHFKCVHRIVPYIGIPPQELVPPDWMLNASRKDYYDHMKATEEGRKILREYRKSFGDFSKSKRVFNTTISLLGY